jgi:hypothetical protein
MGSHDPLFTMEPVDVGVWLGGEIGTPPAEAEIFDRWLPNAQTCHVLTAAGWVIDQQVTELLLRSLRSACA